jgi:uncharacterized protein
MEALTEIFDGGAVWHTPGRKLTGRRLPGPRRDFRLFGRLDQEKGGTFRVGFQHLFADDERAVGIQRNTAERDGKRLDVGVCLVFELKDGRVTEGWEHYRDLYAWDEFRS